MQQLSKIFSQIKLCGGTASTSMLKNILSGKAVIRAGRGYDNMDHFDKSF